MKTKNKLFAILWLPLLIALFIGCNKELPKDAKASMRIENAEPAQAGVSVRFVITGSGDFFTFYAGDENHVYENYPVDKGMNVSTSFEYLYNKAGTYEVVLVASSFGNWSEKESQDVYRQTITVVDSRNMFTEFKVKSIDAVGSIDNDAGTITFLVTTVTDLTALKPTFFLSSADAKVFVNGVEQVSESSTQNFSTPVVYTVKAPDGTEKTYTVNFNTYPASAEKALLSLSLSSPDVPAVIDEAAKTISLVAPFGTDLKKTRLFGTSSPLSTIAIGSRSVTTTPKTIDISAQPTTVKVTAEDKSVANYSLTTSLDNPFKTFTFTGLVPEPIVSIDHTAKTINVKVLQGTAVNSLIAEFTGNEAANTKVGTVLQTSGVTANDFSSPVVYSVTGIVNPITVNYTVTVQVLSK